MPQRILGVDVGHWSCKAVLIESSFRSYEVLAAKEVPLTDYADQEDPAREALKELLANFELKADIYVGSFPASKATNRFLELPFTEAKRVDQIIEGELADLLPFDIEDAIADHEIVLQQEDSSISFTSAAKHEAVRSRLTLFQAADIDPKFLSLDVGQLQNLYQHCLKEDASRTEDPSETAEATAVSRVAGTTIKEGRAIIDIGHTATLVAACAEGGIQHIRVIRAGGRDVTQAIQEAYGLSTEQAEAEKKLHAMVSTSRQPAADANQDRISQVTSRGLQTLVTELRRTLRLIRTENRMLVSRIDLLGGGARVRNLPHFLAEELGYPVAHGAAVEQLLEPHVDEGRAGAFGVALALCLRATPDLPCSEVGFRKGEFQFTGGFRQLRERVPAMALAAASIALFLLINIVTKYVLVSRQETAIDTQFCKITQEVVGREICEPTVALAAIRNPTSELGDFRLPKRSAVRVAADLSHLVPKDLEARVDEMDITPDRARVKGKTNSFDSVDKLVSAYGSNECFSNIKKGKLQKTLDGKGVEFPLTLTLECSR